MFPTLMRTGTFRRTNAKLLCSLGPVLVLVSCGSRPGDVREWRASDHSRDQGESQADPNLPPLEDEDPMVAAQGIWQAQCATCHGPTGHGDGPQAPMTRPPDITNEAFQAAWSDEQLRTVITYGRGMMQPYRESIRPEGIDVLVRHVRQLGRPAPVRPPAPTVDPASDMPTTPAQDSAH